MTCQGFQTGLETPHREFKIYFSKTVVPNKDKNEKICMCHLSLWFVNRNQIVKNFNTASLSGYLCRRPVLNKELPSNPTWCSFFCSFHFLSSNLYVLINVCTIIQWRVKCEKSIFVSIADFPLCTLHEFLLLLHFHAGSFSCRRSVRVVIVVVCVRYFLSDFYSAFLL